MNLAHLHRIGVPLLLRQLCCGGLPHSAQRQTLLDTDRGKRGSRLGLCVGEEGMNTMHCLAQEGRNALALGRCLRFSSDTRVEVEPVGEDVI